jgi:ElaB/YqjD/DUF883 family membrane-anchored ribosome-binding protein
MSRVRSSWDGKEQPMRATAIDRELMDRAEHLYRASRKLARQGTTQASSFIHARPILSTLMGVGTGILLGMFLNRRK